MPNIRVARNADLNEIVELFLACWQETYAESLPAQLVALMDRDRAMGLWTRVLTEAESGKVLVAVPAEGQDEFQERGRDTVMGVTRFAVSPQGVGMIHSLYVSPRSQGAGVGSRLLGEATAALARAKGATAQLWVFRDNEPSLASYQSQGWHVDGAERTQAAFEEPEKRLSRALTGAEHEGAE